MPQARLSRVCLASSSTERRDLARVSVWCFMDSQVGRYRARIIRLRREDDMNLG
jgi:hypothetical protein